MKHNDLDKALALRESRSPRFLDEDVCWNRVALAAIPLMTTQSLAQKEGEDPANGKCDDGLVVSKKTGKCQVPKKKAP